MINISGFMGLRVCVAILNFEVVRRQLQCYTQYVSEWV